MPATYRKKPVVIEAVQITERNTSVVASWCHGRVRGTKLPASERTVQIDTLEGEMSGRIGDWIIKGVQGEFYPCKPEIFAATYEQVTTDG